MMMLQLQERKNTTTGYALSHIRTTGAGGKGYENNMTLFGPEEIILQMEHEVGKREKKSVGASYPQGTRVAITAPLDILTGFLRRNGRMPEQIARKEAMSVLAEGWGVIFETDIIDGERMYHLYVGYDQAWHILPERFLKTV